MSRLTLVLATLAGLLSGAVVSYVLRPAVPAFDETQLRALVGEMIASERPVTPPAGNQSVAAIDPKTLNPMIESYLLDNPGILDQMSTKLQDVKKAAERKATAEAIQANFSEIYSDPSNVVLGNPQGDVTLVEMFDYNCGYCRGALPDMATLLAEDPNLRVILKEFPILSQGSVEAARVAVLVNADPSINYWDFHQQLFTSRGQVTGETALSVAEQMGMNRTSLMLNMEGGTASDAINRSYDLARALNVSGTPTYIIGDELIPGAIGIDRLRERIANMRECGSTVCATQVAAEPTG
ncbi:MAG TPA: DsbA family protein [Devosia sp.]|nr:DsbA family protein [Devosia sp.]